MVAIPKGCFTLGADFAIGPQGQPSILSPVAEACAEAMMRVRHPNPRKDIMGNKESKAAALPAVKVRGLAVGGVALRALATGALAIGAAAIGALAIGAVAVGRLRVGDAAAKKLTVGRLEVDELVIGGRSISAQEIGSVPGSL
jgi:hypothetical protein